MKKIRLSISNRNRLYRYGIYRRTETADLMKIDPSVTAPDFFLEPPVLEDHITDTQANGLASPEFILTPYSEFVEIKTSPNRGVTYYYGIVAFKDALPVSRMEMTTGSLRQDETGMETVVRTSGGEEKARFGREIMFLSSQLAVASVPSLQPEEILYDLTDVIISNEVIINMPNVWYDIDRVYNYRQYFPTNILTVLGQHESPSVPLFSEEDKAYVPIHKIEILRKDISDEEPSLTPNEAAETDVEIRKVIVFKSGVYDAKEYQKLPLNMMNRYGTVSVMNHSTLTDTLAVRDRIEHGRTYKYTVRLFDCEERISEPTVLIITT